VRVFMVFKFMRSSACRNSRRRPSGNRFSRPVHSRLLETVPEPMIGPGAKGRCFCSMDKLSWPKIEGHVGMPALARAKSLSIQIHTEARMKLAAIPRHLPIQFGCDCTGEKAWRVWNGRSQNLMLNSPGNPGPAGTTFIDSMIRRMAALAVAMSQPMGTS